MSYVTQGVVKVTLGIKKQLTISPTNDYCVKHRNKTYTIFIEDGGIAAACFDETQPFAFSAGLENYLVQAAFNEVRLQITIEYTTKPEITAVTIPA